MEPLVERWHVNFDDWIGREDELREKMVASHQQDVEDLRTKGWYSLPWEETDIDTVFRVDARKLLYAIEDGYGVVNDIDYLRTEVFGMKATANARAAVNYCLRKSMIVCSRSEADDCEMLDLAPYGRFLIDEFEAETAAN